MNRRRAITAIASSVAILPILARAQQMQRRPIVGILWHAVDAEEEEPYRRPLLDGFARLGYEHGKNIVFEERYPNESLELFQKYAAELVSLNVNVLVAASIPSALAAQRATTSIPVVFLPPPDPVALGLVASLSRPGGNLTGLSSMAHDLTGKRLQLIKETFPNLKRLALLTNPVTPQDNQRIVADIEPIAAGLGFQAEVVEATSAERIDPALASMRGKFQAVYVTQNPLFFAEKVRVAELAVEYRLPLFAPADPFVVNGALMSYGPSWSSIFSNAATYVDKILKGAKPGDLPVSQPTDFDLVFNLRTAKAIGITIPDKILARAKRIIED
jgi:putative ABC transport system substrate-binding protein